MNVKKHNYFLKHTLFILSFVLFQLFFLTKPAWAAQENLQITIQPVSQAVVAGHSASLCVTATGGTSPLSYQWQKDGSDIIGETSATLSIPNFKWSASGSYTVVVSDSTGSSVTGNAAIMTAFDITYSSDSGFNCPAGIAADGSGSIYVADTYNHQIKKMDTNDSNIIILNNGFIYPTGIVVDDSGNIYITDCGDNTVKKMDASGNNIVTLGSGFNQPSGIALDDNGNIYVADTFNNVIKKMDANGNNIVTLGSGFNHPYGIAIDGSGNIYIADTNHSTIKKMDANGNSIITLGSGFNAPSSVAVDDSGNIFVADTYNDVIKKMDANGNNIVTLGSGFSRPAGITIDVGGNIHIASQHIRIEKITLYNVHTVAFDSQGGSKVASMYKVIHGSTISSPAAPAKTGYSFSCWYKESSCINAWNFSSDTVIGNITLYAKWTVPTYTVSFDSQGGSTVASINNVTSGSVISAPAEPVKTGYKFSGWYKEVSCTNAWSFSSDTVIGNITLNAKWTAAVASSTSLGSGFSNPSGIAVDGSGNIYVADTGNNAIKKMNAGGTGIVTLGSGYSSPSCVAVDSSGNIYVADTGNNTVKKMNADGTGIITLGSGFSSPSGIAVDSSGNIYVADTGNNSIKKMNAGGTSFVTVSSSTNHPTGIAVDASGNIYVADTGNNAVKKIGGPIVANLGSGFSSPSGIAVDGSGNIYVSDTGNNSIKKMNASGTNIVTLASGFNHPSGVVVDGSRNIYVADTLNNTVKKIWTGAGTISGTVTSGINPIAGAAVELTVSNIVFSATTEADGSYSIQNVPSGTGYTVTAGKSGYTMGSISNVSVTADTTTSEVDIILTSDEEGCLMIYKGAQKRYNPSSDAYDIRFIAIIDTLKQRKSDLCSQNPSRYRPGRTLR